MTEEDAVDDKVTPEDKAIINKEFPLAKYEELYEVYGGKSLKQMGTRCRCKTCHAERKVRMKKGASLKKEYCFGCGHYGFERWTRHDQERKKKHA